MYANILEFCNRIRRHLNLPAATELRKGRIMPVDCGRLRQIISEFSLVRECDVIRNGYLRISTQFQYLDGSYIDLFLGDLHDLTGEYILTDFGETEGYLSDLPIKLGSSARRRRLVADICESYSVLHSNGEFSVHIHADNFRTLADAIVRLAQVCIRVSDLAMTQPELEAE